MSINLSEAVQKNLSYKPLQKMDPNIQEKERVQIEDKCGQGLIPAMLTGLYRYVQTDEGAESFLQKTIPDHEWVTKVFEDNSEVVIKNLVEYTGEPAFTVKDKMNAIAEETLHIVHEIVPANAGIKEVKDFFTNQRDDILIHLPAELQMGNLLHDNTLDDNTNRMEGPISSLIKNIGNAFTNPVTGKEVN